MQESPSQASFYGRSFLIIVAAYITYFICLMLLSAAVYATGFPDEGKNIFLPPEEFDELKKTDPEKIIPNSFQVILVGINALTAFCIGWLIPKFAPFGLFGHCVFFALVIAVTWFQFGIGGEGLVAKWALLANIAISPVSILVAANISINGIKRQHELTDESES